MHLHCQTFQPPGCNYNCCLCPDAAGYSVYESCSTDCVSALAVEVIDRGGCLQEVCVKALTLVNLAQGLGAGKEN